MMRRRMPIRPEESICIECPENVRAALSELGNYEKREVNDVTLAEALRQKLRDSVGAHHFPDVRVDRSNTSSGPAADSDDDDDIQIVFSASNEDVSLLRACMKAAIEQRTALGLCTLLSASIARPEHFARVLEDELSDPTQCAAPAAEFVEFVLRIVTILRQERKIVHHARQEFLCDAIFRMKRAVHCQRRVKWLEKQQAARYHIVWRHLRRQLFLTLAELACLTQHVDLLEALLRIKTEKPQVRPHVLPELLLRGCTPRILRLLIQHGVQWTSVQEDDEPVTTLEELRNENDFTEFPPQCVCHVLDLGEPPYSLIDEVELNNGEQEELALHLADVLHELDSDRVPMRMRDFARNSLRRSVRLLVHCCDASQDVLQVIAQFAGRAGVLLQGEFG
ncbi:MAG: hypothetical protein MHM6MM_002156 [Cercozoa sp. M6MM]